MLGIALRSHKTGMVLRLRLAEANHANFYDHFGAGNRGSAATDSLTPVGSFDLSPGPYGTYDMGGDVWQWNEANIYGSFRGLGGASWLSISPDDMASSTRYNRFPSIELNDIGFRVASSVAVPETSSLALLGAATLGLIGWRWRRQSAPVPLTKD